MNTTAKTNCELQTTDGLICTCGTCIPDCELKNADGVICTCGTCGDEAAEPTKIVFETRTCRRCEGAGRSTHWGLSRNTCFRCDGEGSLLTEDGKAAREAYDVAIQNSKNLARAEGATVFTVERKRDIMKEIAAQYQGATLVY